MRCTLLLLLCLVPLSACVGDKIHVTSMTGNSSTDILVSGRLQGVCQSHSMWSGSPDSGVANFQTALDCASEAAVFAEGNAMGLSDAVSSFTDKTGDTVDVSLGFLKGIPVNIFIMAGDQSTGQYEPRRDDAIDDIGNAIAIWDSYRCGVT